MAVGSAIIAGLGLGYSIYAGERGAAASRKSRANQRLANSQIEARASNEAQKAELEQQRAANKNSLDIGALLLGQQGRTVPTLLTGQSGDQTPVSLGRKTALGRAV